RLRRRDPRRKVSAAVLEVHAEEALDRSEDRAMEHHRAVVLAVLAGVGELEALRQVRIVLDGAELPAALQRVVDVELHFRSVERAFAHCLLEWETRALETFAD